MDAANTPSIRNAGSLTTPPFVDQGWMLMNAAWMLAALLMVLLIARGRWRLGLALYIAAGAVGIVWYQSEAWLYPTGTHARAEAIALLTPLIPMHLGGWAQIGVVALALGGLARLVLAGLRRRTRPAEGS